MASRLRILGVIMIIVGIVGLGAAGYAFLRYQGGADALQGFSEAQDVQLSYRDGELIDRGTTEGADAILELLGETWRWPIDNGELDPNDPLVNTATEYMYQMATIAKHTLDGTQTVVLTEEVEWDGDGDGEVSSDATVYTGGPVELASFAEDAIYMPGTYEVPVDGRYWTGFNRMHPLDGPARSQAWNGTVHGLFAELGVGATTATSLQLALGVIGITALMGLGFLIVGGGLIWVGGAARKEDEPAAPAA
jgi:hypothetical protein